MVSRDAAPRIQSNYPSLTEGLIIWLGDLHFLVRGLPIASLLLVLLYDVLPTGPWLPCFYIHEDSFLHIVAIVDHDH